MLNSRIKISAILESQLPNFVREDYPLASEFFTTYYKAVETTGGAYDILQNIDQYLKVDNLTNNVKSTTTLSDLEFFDATIQVKSTKGFPETYGLIQINDEVILYQRKTEDSFLNCSRGFSGVTSYKKVGSPEELVFSITAASSHESGSIVKNLSSILFDEFLVKIKKQFTPGFESRSLTNNLSERLFIKQSKDFYSTKGTDKSFKILFKALYDKPVDVIKPRDFLFEPSDARYVITKNLVVEAIEGDPLTLSTKTLRQDKSPYNSNAYGSIISVEKFIKNNKNYYLIELDYEFNKDIDVAGSVFGTFNIHPKTFIVNADTIPQGSTTLEVDSTVGFPNSGELILHIDVYDKNSIIETIEQTIQYRGKTITQFLQCSNVPQILNTNSAYVRINDYSYGINDSGEVVKIRISGVLSDLQIEDNYYLLPNEDITTVNLGDNSNKVSANSWIFNVPITYNIKEFTSLSNVPPYTYSISTYDNHALSRFDKVTILLSNGTAKSGKITSVISSKNIIIDSDSGIIDTTLANQITKKTSKVETNNYPSADGYKANVEAVYTDNGTVYVASPSLPAYKEKVVVNDFSAEVSRNSYNSSQILDIGNNYFLTGDEVVYRKSQSSTIDIEEGIYFIKKIAGQDRKVYLARSRSDIFNNIFITFSGSPINDVLEPSSFAYQHLSPQNIIRSVSKPVNDSSITETKTGELTGIFVNGVEILNYKSNDFVYYGPLESIDVISPGLNYDVINPPILNISDSVGSGATATCSVVGSLKRIDIIDSGFDYISDPFISITGGSGTGCKIKANLSSTNHVVTFNSSGFSTSVNLVNNTIGFSTYHKFRDGEKIVYQTFGQKGITGLTTDAIYHVSIIDSHTIKLYTTYDFAIAKGGNNINIGIGTSIGNYGEGLHSFKALDKKKIISSVAVLNEGSGYKNNKKTLDSSDSNSYNKVIPSLDIIRIKNHGYLSGESVVYETSSTAIGGLTTSTSYIVTKVDDDNFKLSVSAGSTLGNNFYYNTKQYVNLTSIGFGIQSFNYEPIQITVTGILGFTTSTSDYQAVLNPIFRGEIYDVDLSSNGNLYGSDDIVNFNRQPQFRAESGTAASLIPVISDGKIKEVLVNSPGYGYNSTPDLLITGVGNGAILSPVVSNGSIIKVIVVNPGYGYTKESTSVAVVSSGSGAEFNANITSWNINLFEKLLRTKQFSLDDGVLCNGINPNYGLQYSHISPPRSLREIVQATAIDQDGNVIRRSDIDSDTDITGSQSLYHSPIIGWAYDGNPIYGPYGYSNLNSGQISRMKSGYELLLSKYRPSVSKFPQGFFVEDYAFNNNHSSTSETYLDEHNGRYCSTPDFPNGTYAYFCTINDQGIESDGVFKGYRLPIFPYIIGNTYKSKPNQFNFNILSNQNDIDINSTKWLRNTKIYNFLSDNTIFKYLTDSTKDNRINAEVKSTTVGKIESIKIENPGNGYEIGDEVIFDTRGTGGSNSIVKVSQLIGKTITSVSCASSTISDVEFIPQSDLSSYIAITPNQHNISNNSIFRVTGISTSGTFIENTYPATIKRNVFSLKSGIGTVGSTGIVTTISLSGNINFPAIKENDLLLIDSEQVKVLNVYQGSSRIRILRQQNGTIGTSHASFSEITEIPRKLFFNSGISTSNEYKINSEYYFDPEKTVGIGTTSGVGITSTLTLDSNKFNTPVGIGTSSETKLYFTNLNDLTLYASGGYVAITSTRTSSGVSSEVFHVSHAKITSVGSTSIDIDFDSSSLYGEGVTAYLDKKQTIDIPTKTLYIPNHGIKTGTKVTYSPKVGTALSVSVDGSTDIKSLSDFSNLYTIRITDDLIGISSVRVGFNSDGTIVGLGTTSNDSTLYFTGIGTGSYHSIKTRYDNTVIGDIVTNTVTVSTASSHGILVGDKIEMDLVSTATTSIVIQYNLINRRMVANPVTFGVSDIDLDLSTIEIQNHKFKTGDKVIYTATTPMGGLTNNQICYVVVKNTNKIQLTSSYYSTTKKDPDIIVFTSQEIGTLSLVNPPLTVHNNQEVTFDLSSSTLSFGSQSVFKLEFYKDSKFTDVYKSTELDELFEVSRFGTIGVTQDAKVSLKVTSDTPKTLYYRLEPINFLTSADAYKEIVVDDEVFENNTIFVLPSYYNGTYDVSGITTNTITFNLTTRPELLNYTNGVNCSAKYYTNSNNVSGGIKKFDIVNAGYGYKSPPGITTITTNSGSGAIIIPESSSIGSIKKVTIKDIGYDYPSDQSLRPKANLPQVLKVEALSEFSSIGITSAGKNYNIAPSLVVVDGFTLKQVKDVDITYNLGDSVVKILKNTDKISDLNPTIIPINNSNGVKVSNIVYNSSSGIATATLSVEYSEINDFPFKVGNKVIIEYSNIIPQSGSGFNSSDYEYALFPIVSTDPNIGGANPTISYDMSSVLTGSETAGTFDPLNSICYATPDSFFPQFDIKLKRKDFFKKEIVGNNNYTGVVEYWNGITGYLKVASYSDFVEGDSITGQSSKTTARISTVYKFDSKYNVDSSNIFVKGFDRETGFLNNTLQRLHDNDYYQYFSYSLKSTVPLDTWDEPVQALNHTTGFKKFSDLSIESKADWEDNKGPDDTFIGIKTDQNGGNVSAVNDLFSFYDVNCVSDFDLASETSVSFNGSPVSERILFNSKIIQDYSESVTNRVLLLDDISSQFNDKVNSYGYSIVDSYGLGSQFTRKYFAYIKDKRFDYVRQVSFINVVHNGSVGFVNQYGKVYTSYDVGDFDVSTENSSVELQFWPINYRFNNYDINLVSYTPNQSNFSLGDTVNVVGIATTTFSAASSTNVISIGTSYRSSRVSVQIESSGKYQFDEISLLHDGTDVYISEYGRVYTSSGLGTYSASISGSNVVLKFNSEAGVAGTIKALGILIADASSSGVGTTTLSNSRFESFITSIPSSSGISTIARYSRNSFEDEYSASYYIISVEDTTNNEYQLSEVVVIDDDVTPHIIEYGRVLSGSPLGSVGVGTTTTNSSTELYFTPVSGIDVEVRVYQHAIGIENETNSTTTLSNSIKSLSSEYVGTDNINTKFEIEYNSIPVFVKQFDGGNSSVVSIANSTITIPNHYFVTGEEVEYKLIPDSGETAIGIATTTIAGIGVTDLLPSSVYIIKIDDKTVRLAKTAEDALSDIPRYLNISSVGIGTRHKFISKNQNGKSLISIDNVIQSPILETDIKTVTTSDMSVYSDTVDFVGISSFKSGDFIKINNEIMKVMSVGYGATYTVLVNRSKLGTEFIPHSIGSTVTKLEGNYNIQDNSIYFTESPYGTYPVGYSTAGPNDRDYSGITTHSSFSGRVFLRSGEPGGTRKAYYDNYIFDDLTSQFNGITTSFTLKSLGSDVVGVQTNNPITLIDGIFQNIQRIDTAIDVVGNYDINENSSGISTIIFLGSVGIKTSDINTSRIPVGGVIYGVGSTEGFGYQPLVSAGATVQVSAGGTIESISIGNSGSGYRSAIQTVVNVYGKNSIQGSSLQSIGTAAVSGGNIVSIAITNPGIGYTAYPSIKTSFVSYPVSSGSTIIYSHDLSGISTGDVVSVGAALTNVSIVGIASTFFTIAIADTTLESIGISTIITFKENAQPVVVIDSPLSYTNIPLIYSSDSSGPGIGSGAMIDIFVGSGTSIFDYTIKNNGYGYKSGEILTVDTTSGVGIPTDVLKSFKEFQIFVDQTIENKFSAWSVGQLQLIDDISPQFNGIKKSFTLAVDGNITSITARKGSNIDIKSNLLVFLNDVLQTPGDGYIFDGGSIIRFPESPKGPDSTVSFGGDKCKILYYRGTKDIDVVDVDILETVKVGDDLTLIDENPLYTEDERLVTLIDSSTSVLTNPYPGPGINTDSEYLRAVKWCRQTEDKIINGKPVGKDRVIYEALINPVTNIIKSVGVDTSIVFVSSIKPFFVEERENIGSVLRGKIEIYNSIDTNVSASATAVVSSAGTITSISVVNGGFGYNSAPTVTISDPYGIGTTQRATATSSITSGVVTSITVNNPGIGYTLGPISNVSISSTFFGRNFPSIGTDTFRQVRLSTITGSGKDATGNISILNDKAISVSIAYSGFGYKIGDLLRVEYIEGVKLGSRIDLTVSGVREPLVLISPPTISDKEIIEKVTYEGDFGIVTGVGTTSIGVAYTGLTFDFFIPHDSPLRDTDISVGLGTTGVSGIQSGYYFIINNSNIGSGITSYDLDGNIVGFGTTCLDNIYQAVDVQYVEDSNAIGVGITSLIRVTVSVNDYDFVGIGTSAFFGEFSWGKINAPIRKNPKSFIAESSTGVTGFNTCPIVRRLNSLKYEQYSL